MLRLFLRLVAYFVFLDAWLAFMLMDGQAGINHVLPAALVIIRVGFAVWFVARLPRALRPYLFRHALSPRHAVATILDVVAARFWLWAWPKAVTD